MDKNHYREVKEIKQNPEHFVQSLFDLLQKRQFKNGKYEVFERVTGNKTRTIYKLPFFPDRVVHHCIVQAVGQMWCNNLISDTFSTIPGRGPHYGASRVKKAVLDTVNAKYCLKIDIKKYYPSIEQHRLKYEIRRKIKDKYFLELLDTIIDSSNGIPIGNYVSQWFGNIFLSNFDHYVKEKLHVKYYFRYCDDMVFLGPSKDVMWAWFNEIKAFLNQLGLSIKKHDLFPVAARGVDFIGYRFFPGFTLVRKNIVKSMKKTQHKPKSKASYFGWLVHANCYRLISKYYANESYARRRYPSL